MPDNLALEEGVMQPLKFRQVGYKLQTSDPTSGLHKNEIEMATTKTNRQAEATRLKKENIDRQIEEHRKAIKQLKDEIKKHLGDIKLLVEQKREHSKTNRKPDEYSIYDNKPIIKIASLGQLPKFMEMIKEWKKYMSQEIVLKKTTHIDFDLKGRPIILRTLIKALNEEIDVFCVSERKVLLYLSLHTNLGNYECLKKAVYRERKRQKRNSSSYGQKCGDTKFL